MNPVVESSEATWNAEWRNASANASDCGNTRTVTDVTAIVTMHR